MGWIISLICIGGYFINANNDVLIAAGLFAIAGSLGNVAIKIEKLKPERKD